MTDRRTTTERTARHLQSLYVVGAGLGIAIALGNMTTAGDSDPSMDWASVFVVIAFIATLIPFFHGAMLYMDTQFRGSPGVVMVDFLALFSQTVLFFIMAGFIREPTSYVWAWIVLLVLDVAWVLWLMSSFVIRAKDQPSAQTREEYRPWAVINWLCTAVLLVVVVAVQWRGWEPGPNLGLALALAAIAIVRTGCDYGFSRDVYFGKKLGPSNDV